MYHFKIYFPACCSSFVLSCLVSPFSVFSLLSHSCKHVSFTSSNSSLSHFLSLACCPYLLRKFSHTASSCRCMSSLFLTLPFHTFLSLASFSKSSDIVSCACPFFFFFFQTHFSFVFHYNVLFFLGLYDPVSVHYSEAFSFHFLAIFTLFTSFILQRCVAPRLFVPPFSTHLVSSQED